MFYILSLFKDWNKPSSGIRLFFSKGIIEIFNIGHPCFNTVRAFYNFYLDCLLLLIINYLNDSISSFLIFWFVELRSF